MCKVTQNWMHTGTVGMAVHLTGQRAANFRCVGIIYECGATFGNFLKMSNFMPHEGYDALSESFLGTDFHTLNVLWYWYGILFGTLQQKGIDFDTLLRSKAEAGAVFRTKATTMSRVQARGWPSEWVTTL